MANPEYLLQIRDIFVLLSVTKVYKLCESRILPLLNSVLVGFLL